jgi:hypothetical protein
LVLLDWLNRICIATARFQNLAPLLDGNCTSAAPILSGSLSKLREAQAVPQCERRLNALLKAFCWFILCFNFKPSLSIGFCLPTPRDFCWCNSGASGISDQKCATFLYILYSIVLDSTVSTALLYSTVLEMGSFAFVRALHVLPTVSSLPPCVAGTFGIVKLHAHLWGGTFVGDYSSYVLWLLTQNSWSFDRVPISIHFWQFPDKLETLPCSKQVIHQLY